MEVKQNCRFSVMFEVADQCQDERFTKVKIWLMHTGKNHNGSVFDKEVVQAALPTLGYIPILGFIEMNSEGEEDFSDHRYVLTKKDGETVSKYVGSAYGAILSEADNNAHFETRLCDDGIKREFVVVDGIIWNQFDDALSILERDKVKNHSMELFEPSVDGYEDDSGWFHFTEFSFQGACILGKDYRPGMESSTIELQFTMKDFIKELQNEIINKVNLYAFSLQIKGGTINNMEKQKPIDLNFTLTHNELFNEICNIVYDAEKVKDRWGDEVNRYHAIDLQENEVIVMDRLDHYNYYGFPYSMIGDKVEIDFKNKTRKKTIYQDFDESDNSIPNTRFELYINYIEDKACQKITEVEADKDTFEKNYSTLKKEYDEILPQYTDYVSQEKARKIELTKEAKNKIFARFDPYLSSDDRYKEMKKDFENMTVDAISSRCALLYTEKSLNTNFSNNKRESSSVLDVVEESFDNNDPVAKRYGIRK